MSSYAFEGGQMWNTYQEMENQFIDYLDYVPLTGDHSKVYSGKLLRLMLQLGGYIDTAFKEIACCNMFDNNPDCLAIREKVEKNKLIPFNVYLKTFEPIYEISKRPVIVKSQGHFTYQPLLIERFAPFNAESGGITPSWWRAYNGVKHNMLKNVKEANVENTLKALAAAFLLNAIFEPSLVSLVKEEIAEILDDGSCPAKSIGKEQAEEVITKKKPKKNVLIRVDSKLFICMVKP